MLASDSPTIQATHMDGGPDIAVEIVARDSQTRDFTEKRASPQKRAIFLRLRNGAYEEMVSEGTIFRSEVLAGFWLNTDSLLSRNVPKAYKCLQEILTTEK